MNSDLDMAYLYGLVYDFVVICIKMYNFKGSKKYDHIHVIVFFTSLKRTWISIWHTFMGLWNDYVVICITLNVVKNMTVFMSLILILRRFFDMGHNLVK